MSLYCPEAVFHLLRRAWSFKMEQEQGKEKGGNMTNIWFLLEFGHRFKASEWIPGAFVCYPKTNTKAFPNIFYKLCDCNSAIKNPMSPGQVGCRPSSSEIPGLPSLFCLILPSSNSGQPFVPLVPGALCRIPIGASSTAAFPWAHICSERVGPTRARLPGLLSQTQLALAVYNPPVFLDNS